MSQAPNKAYLWVDANGRRWADGALSCGIPYVHGEIFEEMLAALKAADAHFTGTFSENGTDHQAIKAAIAKAEASQ